MVEVVLYGDFTEVVWCAIEYWWSVHGAGAENVALSNINLKI